mgnify:CR=1 FL=1
MCIRDSGCTDDDSDGICDDEDDCVGLTVNMYNSNIWISNGWEGLELNIGNQSFTMTDEDFNGVDTACYTGCTSNTYVSMDMGCNWACDNYSWEILAPDGTVLLAGDWPYPIGPDEGYLNYGDDDCSDDDGGDDDDGVDDGYWDCGDGTSIPQGYLCDGSTEFGNAGWPADCANGADETLEECCDSPDYANVEACEGGDDDGGDDGGDDDDGYEDGGCDGGADAADDDYEYAADDAKTGNMNAVDDEADTANATGTAENTATAATSAAAERPSSLPFCFPPLADLPVSCPNRSYSLATMTTSPGYFPCPRTGNGKFSIRPVNSSSCLPALVRSRCASVAMSTKVSGRYPTRTCNCGTGPFASGNSTCTPIRMRNRPCSG